MMESESAQKIQNEDLITWVPYGHMTLKEYKRRVWKNIIVMSLTFMLIYIAYLGLHSLQSSLHRDQGMGTICTSVRYVTLVLSCIFVPKLMIRLITHKWTIVISMAGFLFWCAANGIGTWGSMVPASIINGFFVGPLWAAQGSYFTDLAVDLSRRDKTDYSSRIGLFMGVFYTFVACSGVIGSVISTTVLSSSCDECNRTSVEDAEEYCGMNDCPDSEFEVTANDPSERLVWILCGIYIAMVSCAVIITALFVDHLPAHVVKRSDTSLKQELTGLLTASLHQTVNPLQMMLIPISFYSGVEQSFFSADFNKSWTWCALGISMIGITNVPFSLVSTVISCVGGTLLKFVGRPPIMITGLLVDIMIQATLLLWSVDPSQRYVFFIIPTFWGISDSVWVVLGTALHGIYFPDNTEAAFSVYMLWYCLGLAAGFGYSSFLCTNIKLIIMFSCLVCGLVFYFIAEAYHSKLNGKVVDIEQRNGSIELEHLNKPTSSITL